MVQIVVGVANTQIATRNARRLSITFYNASLLGETISMTKNGVQGLSALSREYVLQPNQGLAFDLTTDGADIQGEWGAYATAATAIIVVGETAARGR